MNVFNEVYYKTLAENENNLKFWENYLQNLRDLDFSFYSDKLKVPALIPIGNRILFRGEIKHTNEVTVALGQGYFVKCSAAQAELLKQRRIKDAEEKVELLKKEKELLENRLYFSKQSLDDDKAQEIIEPYNEEEDKIWRKKHKQQIKKHKKEEKKDVSDKNTENQITDEELWHRLEELELQEELQNELQILSDKDTTQEQIKKASILKCIQKNSSIKADILQKLINIQNLITSKCESFESCPKKKPNVKTESDLIKKLEELEQLEELEDEIDRLDDMTDKSKSDKSSEESDSDNPVSQKIKRSVSFAEDDASETVEIIFEHTDVEPNKDKYDPTKGLTKPSDIYEAYPYLFGKETTNSILKKSKYSTDTVKVSISKGTKQVQWEHDEINDDLPESSTIVVKDIVEKSENIPIKESKARPTSLFKLRRQQRKSQ